LNSADAAARFCFIENPRFHQDGSGRLPPSDRRVMTEGLETRRPVFPVYLFERRRHADDPEIDFVGRLFFNAFGHQVLTKRARREVTDIIAHLQNEVRAGRLPLDDVIIGWPGTGRRPLNAIDTDDEAAMQRWRKRAFKIELRPTTTSVADGRIIRPGKNA
jgi:hypothetical protein